MTSADMSSHRVLIVEDSLVLVIRTVGTHKLGLDVHQCSPTGSLVFGKIILNVVCSATLATPFLVQQRFTPVRLQLFKPWVGFLLYVLVRQDWLLNSTNIIGQLTILAMI